jgi:hypothetical protein
VFNGCSPTVTKKVVSVFVLRLHYAASVCQFMRNVSMSGMSTMNFSGMQGNKECACVPCPPQPENRRDDSEQIRTLTSKKRPWLAGSVMKYWKKNTEPR